MEAHTLQLETLLHQSKYRPQDTCLEQQWNLPNVDTAQDAYFDAAADSAQFSGILYDSISHQHGVTNALNQSSTPNIGFDAERSISHDHQTSRFATQSPSGLVRSFENSVELSSPSGRERERIKADIHCPAYNAHLRPISTTNAGGSPAMPSLYLSANRAPPTNLPATMYSPFRSHFTGSQDAKSYRHESTRFGRTPYIPPETDPSITSIESSRHIHVERIYNAMTRGDLARDNPSSIAMKRWVHAAHYAPDLVEAYAHKVFDCLLLQVKFGYRGWHHNDYVADERKGEDDDRDVDCAGRLDNIIAALEQEKTICEDVMNSACQIRMFVNAPRAYSNRKYQNRIGNSKRGKAKDSGEGSSRALKTRKTRVRSGNGGMPDLSGSRHTTPQSQSQLPLPFFSTPSVQHVASSPLTNTTHDLPATTQTLIQRQQQQQKQQQQQRQTHTTLPSTTSPQKTSTSPPLLPTTPLHSPFSPWDPDFTTTTPPQPTSSPFPTAKPTPTSLTLSLSPPLNPTPTSFLTHDWTPNWTDPLLLLSSSTLSSPPPPQQPSPPLPLPLPPSSSSIPHPPSTTQPALPYPTYDTSFETGVVRDDQSFWQDSGGDIGAGTGTEVGVGIGVGDFRAFWMGREGVQRFPGGS